MLRHGVNLDTKREDRTIFIISLLLHTLVLLFLLFYAFKTRQKFVITKSDKQKQQALAQQNRMPTALIPKRSDMGTEVVFDDRVLLPPIVEKPKQEPKPHEPKPKKIVEKQEKAVKKVEGLVKAPEKPETVPKTVDLIHLQPEKLVIKTKVPGKIKLQEEKTESIVKKIKKYVKKIKEQQRTVQKPITSPKLQQAALANLFQEKPEPKKNLLSLAQCFMDQEDGNSCLARHGAKGVPGLEEMKYICYEKRINDHIVSSWKMLFGGVQIRTRGSVSLNYVINEDGKVENLILVSSSGDKMFDDMVLKCIRNANFPPIPKHFGVKKYRPRGGSTLLPTY